MWKFFSHVRGLTEAIQSHSCEEQYKLTSTALCNKNRNHGEFDRESKRSIYYLSQVHKIQSHQLCTQSSERYLISSCGWFWLFHPTTIQILQKCRCIDTLSGERNWRNIKKLADILTGCRSVDGTQSSEWTHVTPLFSVL